MTKQRLLPILLSAPMAAGLLVACDIDQTESGEMPDVDIDVDPGAMPEYDVDWADVDAGMTTETIQVPKVKVVMEEETVEVPFIDVEMPDEDDNANRSRRTLTASALVPGSGYDMEIQSVYQKNDTLYVISKLTGSGADGEKEMVSDRVVLNAPELDVRHVVIGKRPEGSHNEQFRYVKSMSDLDVELKRAHRIYSN